MASLFEELDYAATPIGPITLRRRFDPTLRKDVFEVKLGEEFLMSSAYTASEVALSKLALDRLEGENLDILVAGLGLGYTAKTALDDPKTGKLLIVEYLEPVIDWHRRGLLPMGTAIPGDPRTEFVLGDFFRLVEGQRFGSASGPQSLDAILVDIDHSPEALLSDHSRPFYSKESLERLSTMLRPGGIFGLWSDDPPDERFTQILEASFGSATAEPVTIERPLAGTPIIQTVYLAQT
ncbi:polyamine aminopropyltransferase [Parvularcula lutaonensis]|uniref:Spermidine synthase n=1 Tax=Parvularcula lutaonensis TaxID=491923 RepID=A0ABV7M8Q1_9PROT|nr:spermidine synthase [Parvularcula lutaonensis]GGY41248.1 spermidine synthase [Parvularcula lutaonensis]